MSDPTPPTDLMQVAIGVPHPAFFRASGRVTASAVLDCATRNGMASPKRVLDFGCGSGRVLAPLTRAMPLARFTAVDIDARSLEWCRQTMSAQIEFMLSGPLPPLPQLDEQDLIVAISVFTHLSPEMQRAWLSHLLDRLSPGGLIVLTVNGTGSLPALGEEVAEQVRRNGHVYVQDGGTQTLPDWYQLSVHSPQGVDALWGDIAAIVDYQPGAVLGFQDLVTLRPLR